MMKSDLSSRHCESCEGIGSALNTEQVHHLMPQLAEGWQATNDHKEIKKSLQLDFGHF